MSWNCFTTLAFYYCPDNWYILSKSAMEGRVPVSWFGVIDQTVRLLVAVILDELHTVLCPSMLIGLALDRCDSISSINCGDTWRVAHGIVSVHVRWLGSWCFFVSSVFIVFWLKTVEKMEVYWCSMPNLIGIITTVRTN